MQEFWLHDQSHNTDGNVIEILVLLSSTAFGGIQCIIECTKIPNGNDPCSWKALTRQHIRLTQKPWHTHTTHASNKVNKRDMKIYAFIRFQHCWDIKKIWQTIDCEWKKKTQTHMHTQKEIKRQEQNLGIHVCLSVPSSDIHHKIKWNSLQFWCWKCACVCVSCKCCFLQRRSEIETTRSCLSTAKLSLRLMRCCCDWFHPFSVLFTAPLLISILAFTAHSHQQHAIKESSSQNFFSG